MSSRFGFLSVVFFAWFVAAAGCGGGDNGSPPLVPPPPPPPPAPAAIVLDGIVSDSPVVAGWIYVFSSADVNAVLDDANAAEDRRSALGDANPIVVLQRDAGDEDSFEFEVPGGRAGEVVFLIFDNADAQDFFDIVTVFGAAKQNRLGRTRG